MPRTPAIRSLSLLTQRTSSFALPVLSFMLTLLSSTISCTASHQREASSPILPTSPQPESREQVPTTYVTPTDAGMIQQRFSDALTELDQGNYDKAASQFDTIAALEPGGPYAAAALFNAALAREKTRKLSEALRIFRRVVERYPKRPAFSKAIVHACRLSARLRLWLQLAECANTWLGSSPSSPVDKIEAHASAALAAVELGDLSRAARQSETAINLFESSELHNADPIPVGAAKAYFAKAELIKFRGEKIKFVPLPPNFADVFEARCQALLDAQQAYSETMRAYDPLWAGLAGLRIAKLYANLHTDILAVPPPPTATTTKQKQLFAGATQLRYRVLLRKGIGMLERTIAMARRTHTRDAWVTEARATLADLRAKYDHANQTISALPYSEDMLRKALQQHASPNKTPHPSTNP